MEIVDEPIDFSVAVERRPVPRQRKVAPFRERPPGPSQPVDWTAGVTVTAARSESVAEHRTAGAAQRAAQPLRRVLQRLLKPGPERT